MDEMIDVVYPIGSGSHMDNVELRYSLRSLSNLTGIRDVYIVGNKPDWCTNVVHIKAEDRYVHNKGANIISKIMTACCTANISSPFIRMSDDNYVLQPMEASDIKPVYNWDMAKYDKWDASNKWHDLLIRTMEYLRSIKKPVFNYETHIPMPVYPGAFYEIMRRTPFEEGPGFVTNSIYFNVAFENHTKIDTDMRAVFMDADTPFKITDKHKFLCHNDAGFSYDLLNYLKFKFPNPSKYER